jgi:hypothetical protein
MTDEQREHLAKLATLPDEPIDTGDISEILASLQSKRTV